ncbi:MAG: NAD-dependent epimerase/dehydratase family protein [Bacteroidetes bacterium]|nr:NAD-dependent epimerase/dehydratase family protein [Bacteroidota bacterium]
MNLLITGIHGFVGNNLISALQKHHLLYGLDIMSPRKEGVHNTFSWNELDRIPMVDVVIHLAGKAHDTKNTSSSQEYFDINVGLTQKIFQHFLKSSATKFIFFSSVKAVVDSVNGDHLTEEETPIPITPYGKSKLEAEKYILEEWEKWKETERRKDGETERQDNCTTPRLHDSTKEKEFIDKNVYILRPCMIHGPGNKGNLNLLFNLQKSGFPWPLGAFENKRSFCAIDNVSFVIQQLIEKDIASGIYQIADDEALSTNRLITLMAESQNKKAKIWHIPVQLIKSVAQLGDFLHLPLNSERLRKLTESYVVSNAKIKQALSINQMPISAQEGMKKTLKSF